MSNQAIALEAAVRKEFGKGAARRARRAGQIPVVVYANEFEPLHILVDRLDFTAIIRNHGTNAVVSLDIEGEKQLAMIKSVDQNVLTFNIDHADLLAIKRGEKVEVDIPVVHTGEIAAGAMLMQDAETIRVEADVMNIPEEIVLDVEGMEIGSTITAGDVQMPDDCTLVDDPEMLIIHVVVPEVADVPEEGGQEDGTEDDAAEVEETSAADE
ncbi:50S ribosomal protein L25/general stress protein Ctc [Corynebacterium argentoratense]|uniref:50S ribosomal protein L25/general stress protein Ctc n=1 Tax=Corynebacterium argentoratense TaxID=42817 RepID=UPI001F299A09|nr:50S ribosomal protein L25/general stress protein Ctc [Corynebacterium argentoratense]MCF1765200.1 50S ribosomal protein L25/general stress protein Ctc [Corynebacterium argentoratense]